MKYPLLLSCWLLSVCAFGQEQQTLWTAAWSPNDSLIAIGGDQGVVHLFDGQTYALLKTYPVDGAMISRMKWHPTANKLAVVTQSTTFKAQILDLDQDQWIPLAGMENSFRGLDWNHSGEYLAVSEYEGPVSIFDPQGNRVSRFIADDKGACGLDWHPTENILATVGSQIGVYSLTGDTLLTFQPRSEEALLLCVEWHPSGDFFAVGDYGDMEANHKLLQFWSPEGELITQWEGSLGEYRNIRWSPDGKLLAGACDALRIWSETGELVHAAEPAEDYLWGIDWNAKGDKIITSSSEGVISIWTKEAVLLKELEY